ncbi:aminoglycoside 3-N-acetyltransferase [Nitratireductor sp. ZSWI3]|uniref:aminoglycoside 3-N-acetyltransferase n=1 Tax=Nitratireductor sp. ZSWI3 TaxID=2966359 RepID=UPI00214FC568|nr:aminoglycoside 3-N-acetyltransferase [Nitratireductor sp. ZSWI3]MCR4266638.1 aminoglycoside 3-N-acetyltransferase [Nitratireductor sp. ZSWI3]
MHKRHELEEELRGFGVNQGDTLMVHASLKAVGPVAGGAEAIVDALLGAVGDSGTLMAYVSWDRSPYEETLNGAELTRDERDRWPAFDPATAGVERSFGLLNAFLVRRPGARRSAHPDASMVAIGAHADHLVAPHDMNSAYGPGSPIERFVALGGKVLLLGAPLDAVTVLHYAEAIADIANKRWVTCEMPLIDGAGNKVWVRGEDFDSNGILDCYAIDDAPDAVERIARDYVAAGHAKIGKVGDANCHLFDASDIVKFGVEWLEHRHGGRSEDGGKALSQGTER